MILDSRVYIGIDERLRKYFAKSSMYHLGILIIFLVSTLSISFFKEKKRKENIRIVESSVRVDVVAMPEMTIKELRTMGLPKVGQEVPDTVSVKKVDPEPVGKNDFLKTKKKKNFLSMMKNLAQKKTKNTVKKSKSKTKKTEKGVLDGLDHGSLKKLILQGNKLSKGTSITGSGQGATDAFSIYLGRLPEFVKPHWTLPSYLLDKEHKCRIRIFLSPNGKLIRSEIYESSGNTEYDSRAMAAVKKASPFPQLAEEFKKRGISGDIVLGFPL